MRQGKGGVLGRRVFLELNSLPNQLNIHQNTLPIPLEGFTKHTHPHHTHFLTKDFLLFIFLSSPVPLMKISFWPWQIDWERWQWLFRPPPPPPPTPSPTPTLSLVGPHKRVRKFGESGWTCSCGFFFSEFYLVTLQWKQR